MFKITLLNYVSVVLCKWGYLVNKVEKLTSGFETDTAEIKICCPLYYCYSFQTLMNSDTANIEYLVPSRPRITIQVIPSGAGGPVCSRVHWLFLKILWWTLLTNSEADFVLHRAWHGQLLFWWNYVTESARIRLSKSVGLIWTCVDSIGDLHQWDIVLIWVLKQIFRENSSSKSWKVSSSGHKHFSQSMHEPVNHVNISMPWV